MHFIMNSLYAFNYSCTGIGNLAIEENPIIYVQKYNILDINIRLCLLSGLGMGDSLRFQRVCLRIGTTQSGYQTCATGIARDYGAATGRERVLWNAVSYPPLCGRGSEDGIRLALRDGIAGPRMAADFSPSPGSRRLEAGEDSLNHLPCLHRSKTSTVREKKTARSTKARRVSFEVFVVLAVQHLPIEISSPFRVRSLSSRFSGLRGGSSRIFQRYRCRFFHPANALPGVSGRTRPCPCQGISRR